MGLRLGRQNDLVDLTLIASAGPQTGSICLLAGHSWPHDWLRFWRVQRRQQLQLTDCNSYNCYSSWWLRLCSSFWFWPSNLHPASGFQLISPAVGTRWPHIWHSFGQPFTRHNCQREREQISAKIRATSQPVPWPKFRPKWRNCWRETEATAGKWRPAERAEKVGESESKRLGSGQVWSFSGGPLPGSWFSFCCCCCCGCCCCSCHCFPHISWPACGNIVKLISIVC